jgi:hypothetical protein
VFAVLDHTEHGNIQRPFPQLILSRIGLGDAAVHQQQIGQGQKPLVA